MKITFANNYTTPGGRSYKAGTTAEVNDADARSLLVRGKARRAEPEYDKGGILSGGARLVKNETGEPEQILTQSDATAEDTTKENEGA